MSKEKKRDYFGFVVPGKVYVGEKSVNIQIVNERVMDLVGALLKGFVAGKTVDIAIFLERKDKRLTVTAAKA